MKDWQERRDPSRYPKRNCISGPAKKEWIIWFGLSISQPNKENQMEFTGRWIYPKVVPLHDLSEGIYSIQQLKFTTDYLRIAFFCLGYLVRVKPKLKGDKPPALKGTAGFCCDPLSDCLDCSLNRHQSFAFSQIIISFSVRPDPAMAWSRSPSTLNERIWLLPTHPGFQATSILVIHLSPWTWYVPV